MCDNVEEDLVKMDVMKVSEEDLRQMKRDREKMSEEFQHFLQVNLKKSTHDDNKSQIECEQSQQKVVNSLNVTQVVRNLNESPRSPLCHLSPHASDGMKTQHGISSSVLMSIRESPEKKTVKSNGGGAVEKKKMPPHGERTADDTCKKVKNYDPIEMRRYMRDQQKKRQMELKKTLTCDQARKLEIQKRLADLQENTKKILGRNVKQKVMGKKLDSAVTVRKNANGSKGSQKVVAKIKGNNTVKKSPRTTSATENRGNFHHVRIVGTPKVPQGVNTNDLDKNLPSHRDKSHKIHDKSNGGKVMLGESGKVIEGESGIEVKSSVEKLQVPDHLKVSMLKEQKKKKPSNENLPHWLRPTPVNIYPYNFITAVREKLDAISNAQLPEKYTITHLKSIPKDTSASSGSKSSGSRKNPDKWTDINRWTLQQEYNAKRGRSLEDPPQKVQNSNKKNPNTRSISEGLLTNFSSISLHLPESNTISDISSIQSEIFPSSIRLSSTKISRSERASVSDGGKSPEASPETTNISASSGRSVKGVTECIAPAAARDNNQLSPLSAELADTMRIMSQPGKRVEEVVIAKEQPNDDGNSNNEGGGGGKIGEFRSLSSDKFKPLDTSANRQEIHEGNLTDLLEAFNRSLTQVIQMNQQLYSALNKSPNATQHLVKNPPPNEKEEEIISAPKATEDSGKNPKYEDSFEEVNSTVKSVPRDDQKLLDDDATAAPRESVREIDGSEGVDKSGEIDLGSGTVNCRANKSTEESNGLEARAIDGNLMDARETNSTIGSDIFAVFNQTDMEVSYISSGGDEARETSITYSNIGLMIKTEKLKGDHLMTMIRMREKALIDRTRGQIAWLELQKKRFRDKGRVLEISAIRKKQRAILLKLERERAELQRQLRTQTHTMMARKSPSHRVRVVEKTISNVVSLRRSPVPPPEHRGAIKGYEIEAGDTLEKLLEQREKELQKRREHVEFLLQWHQRLEKEEKDVKEMEKKLLNSNLERLTEKNLPALTEKSEIEEEDVKLKRVEDIDKSLQILQNIVQESGNEGDFVDVRGVKLNNLWKKLVGREEEKFQPKHVYKMTKNDFSQLYEEAKMRILKEFHDEQKMQQLLEESMASVTKESNSQGSGEEKCQDSENAFQDYSTDDFETVTSVKESPPAPPQETQQKDSEKSQEESSKNSQESNSQSEENQTNSEKASSQSETPVEDSFRDESTEVPRNVETYQDSAQDNIPSIEEGFSQEILNEAEEEQLISEMTLPSFSETTIVDEATVEEIEGLEENVQIQDRSSENISNSPEEETEVNCQDSDLSVNSKSEIFDNISQESLNTIQESVSIDSPEDNVSSIKEVPTELEKRIIEVDVSLKDLSNTMEKSPILEALSPREDSSVSSPEASVPSSEESRASTSSERSENPSQGDDNPSQETSSKFIQEAYGEVYPKSSDDSQGSGSFSQQKIRDYKIPNRMPDIISEAELLRRQQMQIEQEIKQLEQSVPAVFLREIPNKPPPPYVPPAQDSPLATIFPSEERIAELVNNRTKELYASNQSAELDKSECHNITNVYEKIIVGMCEEIYGEIKETLDTQYDAPFQRVRLYRNKLAFFNPPDRLGCIQEHILESIGRILPGAGSYPRQSLQLPANSRRKRDQIDEIVIEEMLEDDWKWSNFQIEETEVLDTMTETIFSTLLEDAIRDIDVAYTRKFPPNT
ncbi:centrosome-associated protein 350-like isoform X3 [Phlebotomus papatasi]|uniref:centrosome-associated protein 350-like isoform X3 n=1 Tax=Phlebotomus papatasi TaxID=29031 RepID=UPI0024844F6F|nr:centrosome-associated protein 350-like isoform X3 [Phlebotomus papatasi]